jgi:hypothetical protein
LGPGTVDRKIVRRERSRRRSRGRRWLGRVAVRVMVVVVGWTIEPLTFCGRSRVMVVVVVLMLGMVWGRSMLGLGRWMVMVGRMRDGKGEGRGLLGHKNGLGRTGLLVGVRGLLVLRVGLVGVIRGRGSRRIRRHGRGLGQIGRLLGSLPVAAVAVVGVEGRLVRPCWRRLVRARPWVLLPSRRRGRLGRGRIRRIVRPKRIAIHPRVLLLCN